MVWWWWWVVLSHSSFDFVDCSSNICIIRLGDDVTDAPDEEALKVTAREGRRRCKQLMSAVIVLHLDHFDPLRRRNILGFFLRHNTIRVLVCYEQH